MVVSMLMKDTGKQSQMISAQRGHCDRRKRRRYSL